MRRLDEETIANRLKGMRRIRRWRPAVAGERVEIAMKEFLARLEPPRNPSPDLILERQARFHTECNLYRASSGVEEEFVDASLVDLPGYIPAKYHALARRLLNLIDAPGQLVIVGDRGRGKTHLACGLINAFCDVGRRGIYRRTRDYFNELSRAEWASKDRIRRIYLEPALLVLDEVQVRDAEREWQDNELTDLIDRRWARHRSTVMLANCQPAALWKNLGASIQRRVIESGDVWQTDWPRIKELTCRTIQG